MSSKTRYYLEQCIPEMDDLVEKNLFTKNEVSLILKKRTDFEHRLNSRGSSINDYMKYIIYETNVDKLRQKRVKRILQASRSNSLSDWSIQQRITFIYQRGTNKFPNDLKFWAMYLNFLKTRGAKTSYKKIHNVYNEVLKLHPNNVDIWISCAKYEYEVHANFKSCRTVFQNGLRFNPDVAKLWYEYVKFELNFITKLINRRKVMGLISEREQELDMLNEENDNKGDEDGNETSTIKAPSTGDNMKDKLNELPEADMNMLGNTETNPALRGDIALTIFDVAMTTLRKHFINKHKGYYAVSDKTIDGDLEKEALQFLFEKSMQYINLFDKFTDLQRDHLINHVLQFWRNELSGNLQEKLSDIYISVLIMDITLNVRYMTLNNLDIPQLQLSVKKYFAYKDKIEKSLVKDLQSKYKLYLQDTFLNKIEKTNPVYNILSMIIKKL
ncbi:snoRNA-binding rRNA-processing protein UTP6 NDAI_0H01810 [Naumovozyma dairenensis CBS 421]|uniref:mRNA 3'-end-processing protein RNA14 n=1 Tax=Naumovozyma dairenensis (strain ATCC 10597 / BCRC 20456 / CBS 421 / NBRC 0211 / NRRL Y-12639) TaxID=1071378 RepID=G0WEZ4_NAUDC|nr:hypothetical protein NDAI_0H01810 [Naumovozyma dairenensis CBS 421]CCD26355.1 hypothetical protein NDAI_0H01810 [Naumovozyma dairenensis CBS 421]